MAIGVGVTSKGVTASANSQATTANGTTVTGSTFYIAGMARNTTPFSSVSDTFGNTYTLVGTEQTVAAFSWGRLYRCDNGTGGANHTGTIAITGGPAEITVFFLEVTGAATASFDKTAQQEDTASPFTSTATPTTAQANELLLGFFIGTGPSATSTHAVSGSTPAAGSWTLQANCDEINGTNHFTGCFATAIVSATGAYEAGFTEAGNTTDGGVIIATVKDAAGGGGGFVPQLTLLGAG